jgi:hypothetical protein
LTVIAAFLRAGVVEAFPEQIEEGGAGLDLGMGRLPIEGERQVHAMASRPGKRAGGIGARLLRSDQESAAQEQSPL